MAVLCAATLLLALGAGLVLAGSRSGGGFKVVADGTDCGGQRVTSALYRIDGSVGWIGGISSNVTPAEMLKAGYIGQLTEVTNFTATAALPSINEGGTNQLGGVAVLDDATILIPAGADVVWGAALYPIMTISAGGLATVFTVNASTNATFSGTYLSLSATGGFAVVWSASLNPTVFVLR